MTDYGLSFCLSLARSAKQKVRGRVRSGRSRLMRRRKRSYIFLVSTYYCRHVSGIGDGGGVIGKVQAFIYGLVRAINANEASHSSRKVRGL